MKSLQTKKANFTEKEIVIFKKKGDIIIDVNNIRHIEYKNPNFFNCLLSSLVFDGLHPGYMRIFLSKKKGRIHCYVIKIKYKEFLELPKIYREKCGVFN